MFNFKLDFFTSLFSWTLRYGLGFPDFHSHSDVGCSMDRNNCFCWHCSSARQSVQQRILIDARAYGSYSGRGKLRTVIKVFHSLIRNTYKMWHWFFWGFFFLPILLIQRSGTEARSWSRLPALCLQLCWLSRAREPVMTRLTVRSVRAWPPPHWAAPHPDTRQDLPNFDPRVLFTTVASASKGLRLSSKL